MSVLCISYAEGHMIYSDEDGVTDFNGDGKTDFDDFILFVAAFGSQQVQFDLNQNGLVDFPDFLVFISAFGQPGSGSSGGTQGDAPMSAQAFQHFADRLNIQLLMRWMAIRCMDSMKPMVPRQRTWTIERSFRC